MLIAHSVADCRPTPYERLSMYYWRLLLEPFPEELMLTTFIRLKMRQLPYFVVNGNVYMYTTGDPQAQDLYPLPGRKIGTRPLAGGKFCPCPPLAGYLT